MTPEQEKKWKGEAKTVAQDSGAVTAYHDLIIKGYLAARKAAQVKIDERQSKVDVLRKALFNRGQRTLQLLKNRDQEISRLKAEIDQAIKDEKDWGFILSLKDQLKDSHEEIERLKKLNKCGECENRLMYSEDYDYELQLKDRDQEISRLKAENDSLLTQIADFVQRNQDDIKSLEQENERLKKAHYEIESGNFDTAVAEREEMIREAIPWITDSVLPHYKAADQRIWGKETEEIKKWLERANKLIRGER